MQDAEVSLSRAFAAKPEQVRESSAAAGLGLPSSSSREFDF